MRYPQTFVDDLKRQADIVRVVQDYVQLKKKGANWMAFAAHFIKRRRLRFPLVQPKRSSTVLAVTKVVMSSVL